MRFSLVLSMFTVASLPLVSVFFFQVIFTNNIFISLSSVGKDPASGFFLSRMRFTNDVILTIIDAFHYRSIDTV